MSEILGFLLILLLIAFLLLWHALRVTGLGSSLDTALEKASDPEIPLERRLEARVVYWILMGVILTPVFFYVLAAIGYYWR